MELVAILHFQFLQLHASEFNLPLSEKCSTDALTISQGAFIDLSAPMGRYCGQLGHAQSFPQGDIFISDGGAFLYLETGSGFSDMRGPLSMSYTAVPSKAYTCSNQSFVF